MSKKRDEYIDQLLSDLRLLEQRLFSVKESDALPFSFFSASFDRIEKISRSLHELELMQIGEMKEQMERLVSFLSENSSKETDEIVKEEGVEAPSRERITLPEYRDPRTDEMAPSSIGKEQTLHFENNEPEKHTPLSLNDFIQAPPALLDLKRGISLNDRFLFQRELFNNNRQEMDKVMETLNKLGSLEEAENYLMRQYNWDFEDQTVKEFLLVIKKGFE